MRLRTKIKNTEPGSLLLAGNRHRGRLEETPRFTAEGPTPSVTPRRLWPKETTVSKDGEQSVSQGVSACGWGPRAEQHSQQREEEEQRCWGKKQVVHLRVFPGGLDGKESASQCRRWKRHGFDPWVGKIPWKRTWQPTPVLLPGEFHGQRSLVGYSPWGCKVLDMTEHMHTHTPPKEHLHDWDVTGQRDASEAS